MIKKSFRAYNTGSLLKNGILPHSDMNKYMILMLICTMFSAVSQILLKQSANEEHASALREYLNWRVIVAYLIFGSVLLLNTYAYTQVDLKYGPVPLIPSSVKWTMFVKPCCAANSSNIAF